MSTQKNEQHHILSPEWLTRNKVPDDAQYRPFEFPDGSWLPSRYTGCVLTPEEVIDSQYRTQRADLPPEAYITPPQKNEHNPDRLRPETVGEGWRLLTKGEVQEIGDEWWYGGEWCPVHQDNVGRHYEFTTTRRRLTG